MRTVLLLAGLAAGCAAAPRDPARLGPWRRLPTPVKVLALAVDGVEADDAWVAGEGRLLRIRLRDGAVLEARAADVVQDGLAAVDGRLYALTDDRLLQVEPGRADLAFPLPGRNSDGFAVDRRRGTLFVASGSVLYRRSFDAPAWEEVGRAASTHGTLCPRVSDGVLYTRAGVYRHGEGFRSYAAEDAVEGVFGAWQSREDPDFMLLAARPGPAQTSDRGRSLSPIPLDTLAARDPCGREQGGRRLLFLQTNSGKSSLGALWGTSTIWMSDGVRSGFFRLAEAPTVALALEATREGLLLLGQDGAVWAAALEAN
jgi:hypothetical protein